MPSRSSKTPGKKRAGKSVTLATSTASIEQIVEAADGPVRRAWGEFDPPRAAIAVRAIPGSARAEVFIALNDLGDRGGVTHFSSGPRPQFYAAVTKKVVPRTTRNGVDYLEIVDSQQDIEAGRSPVIPTHCSITASTTPRNSREFHGAVAVPAAMVAALPGGK